MRRMHSCTSRILLLLHAIYVSAGFNVLLSSGNTFTRATVDLLVPPLPTINPGQTLFIWPGLQPGYASNFLPIDNGVLQPVLTHGSSCAPNQLGAQNEWWISAQYVNTVGQAPGYSGCYGGPAIQVQPGDTLRLDFSLAGTTWMQTVQSLGTGMSVSFAIDMENQGQGWFELVTELTATSLAVASYVPAIAYANVALAAQSGDGNLCAGIAPWSVQKDGPVYEVIQVGTITVNAEKTECTIESVKAWYSANPVTLYPGTSATILQNVCNLNRVDLGIQQVAPVKFNLTNDQPFAVKVYWYHDGQMVLYATLNSGQSWEVNSYFTHVWMVVSDDSAATTVAFSFENSDDANTPANLMLTKLPSC
ncbi:hypothetical protein BC830DRAFT_1120302 [Chytriomyces sp. MP71]|nr:hypothetical protein BC830DRAFT_1120302 [Chytriomyces sp. MP71]